MEQKSLDHDFIKGSAYAPAPESTAIVHLKERYGLFIDGKFQPVSKNKLHDTIDPSNERILSRVTYGSKADVDKAVAAAKKAFGPWSRLPGKERAKYIFRIARLIQERSRELAIVESMNGGKPIRESRDVDIPLAAAHFFYYAGWADKLDYAFPGRKCKPVGIAGQIIPWNFPLLMAAWKLAPALASGNTAILKPAETTPLTALVLAEIIEDSGLPEGVVNIVTGGPETGIAIVNHPDVNKIAFTGSTEVGKIIQKSLSGTEKRFTLELGGKAAHIVFEDAAIDQAVEGVVNGIFFNQGHVCCAGSRLYVQEGIADRFMTKLKKRIDTLIVGDPLDKNTDIGAINSRMQLDKIKTLVTYASNDSTVYQPDCGLPRKGFWYRPTMISDVSQSHRVVQEEIFGPVLAVQTFRTVDEAVEKANNTPYGLSGGVWTEKGAKIFNITNRIKAGVMWANTYNKFDPTSPFGGYKESGMGREGGLHGLLPYVELI